MNEEQKIALKQWHYCSQLAKYMFEEGLLDRQEVLHWILDLLDKIKSNQSGRFSKTLWTTLIWTLIGTFAQQTTGS